MWSSHVGGVSCAVQWLVLLSPRGGVPVRCRSARRPSRYSKAAEISAYHHARACQADAPSGAGCLLAVDGLCRRGYRVFPGGGRVSADYALDVRTASRTLHLTFSADSPMLRYAVDGDPAVVTMWRGVPLSVVTGGRSEVTASVPVTGLARDLGNSEKAGGRGRVLRPRSPWQVAGTGGRAARSR